MQPFLTSLYYLYCRLSVRAVEQQKLKEGWQLARPFRARSVNVAFDKMLCIGFPVMRVMKTISKKEESKRCFSVCH